MDSKTDGKQEKIYQFTICQVRKNNLLKNVVTRDQSWFYHSEVSKQAVKEQRDSKAIVLKKLCAKKVIHKKC